MSRHGACPPHEAVNGCCRKCGARKPTMWPHYLLFVLMGVVVITNAIVTWQVHR